MGPQNSLRELLNAMNERDVRHIPIVEHGELVGMVSDRDLRLYLGEIFTDLSEHSSQRVRLETPARDIMQEKPISVSPTADGSEMVELLLENKIGALLVVEPGLGALRGIVSYEDILQAVADELAI